MKNTIYPGRPMLDTDGNPIQAHGASVIRVGDTFYWYGENKEYSTPGSGIWHYGVRCYSSRDLVNWKSEGIILPPDTEDEASPIHPSSYMDRPHIVYCEKTGLYVLWVKIMGRDGKDQKMAVYTSRELLSGYEFVRFFNPLGMSSGDFDIVVDGDKAYVVFEKVHTELIVADLTDDYTDVSGNYSSHFKKSGPPDVREAPAVFRKNGKFYIFTSGTTGYFPNPSEVAVADSMHGPWTVLGDPHKDERGKDSYRSQISSVLYVKELDMHIALADRWLTDLPCEMPDVCEAFRRWFSPEGPLPVDEKDDPNRYTVQDTSKANYVWLPVEFEGDMPVLRNLAAWSINISKED